MAGALALLCRAEAQVSAEIVLPQDKFLPAEELMAGVRVANQSGRTLDLGEDPDWIQFFIQGEDGQLVGKLSEPPVQRPFRLDSTDRATLSVNLAPCYDLRHPGRYTINAKVKIKNWGATLQTKPASFEVVEGTKLWEQAVGLPGTDTNRPPQIRKFALQQANYLAEPRLYVRVSDSAGEVLKLINVGRMISFGTPEPMIDKQSRLHLLLQNGARSSQYLVIDADGDIQVRQFYEYGEARPRLRLDEKGEIMVSGGVRQESPNDLPKEGKPKRNDSNSK